MKNRILALIAILIFCAVIIGWKQSTDIDTIKEWASEKHCKVISYERNMTIYGSPYNYLNKGQYIYKVKIKDQNDKVQIWWIRTGMWFDYEKN